MATTGRGNTARFFADLRQHNNHHRRVARMLAAQRERRIEQVVRVQRKFRTHQAR